MRRKVDVIGSIQRPSQFLLVPFLALFVVREIPIVGAKMPVSSFFLLALSPGLVRLLLYCYTKVDNPTINLPTMGILYTTTYHRSPSRATKAGQPRRAPGSRQAAAASLTRPAGGGMGWGKSWGNVGICGKPWETQKPSKTYHLEMIDRF